MIGKWPWETIWIQRNNACILTQFSSHVNFKYCFICNCVKEHETIYQFLFNLALKLCSAFLLFFNPCRMIVLLSFLMSHLFDLFHPASCKSTLRMRRIVRTPGLFIIKSGTYFCTPLTALYTKLEALFVAVTYYRVYACFYLLEQCTTLAWFYIKQFGVFLNN